jgi:hypothetical protein
MITHIKYNVNLFFVFPLFKIYNLVSKANNRRRARRVFEIECSFILPFFTLMSSLFLFLLCCLGSLIIHLWFHSDFFAYYLKTFKFLIPASIYEWLLIEDFFKNEDPNLFFDSYIEYLYVKRSFTKSFKIKFFLKLFSCITCFSVWVSFMICIIYCNLLYIGLVFIILRILDFILRYVLKKTI